MLWVLQHIWPWRDTTIWFPYRRQARRRHSPLLSEQCPRGKTSPRPAPRSTSQDPGCCKRCIPRTRHRRLTICLTRSPSTEDSTSRMVLYQSRLNIARSNWIRSKGEPLRRDALYLRIKERRLPKSWEPSVRIWTIPVSKHPTSTWMMSYSVSTVK